MLPNISTTTTGYEIVAGVLRAGAEALRTAIVASPAVNAAEIAEGRHFDGVVEMTCEVLGFQLAEHRQIMRDVLIGVVNDTSEVALSYRLNTIRALRSAYGSAPGPVVRYRIVALADLLWLDVSYADEVENFIRILLSICERLNPRLA